MEATSVLHANHLKKYFGSVRAVEDVSLDVQRNEIFGFLGPNGAGKTTTINLLLGLTYVTAGTITILGKEVTPQHTAVLRRVGTMVGSPELMLSFSARRNLQLLAYLYPEIPAQQRIEEVLELVDLRETTNRPVRTFSSGMKQRLGLALALFNKPELLILDEPTNGMDPAGMQEVRLLLRRLSEQGVTIFLSSHLLHEMELLCDRVAVIQRGQIIAQGKVTDLLPKQTIVQVRTALPQQTLQALRDLPDVRHIQSNASFIEVQGVSSEQVMSFLVARGLTPQEVRVNHPDLESVFLELTR
ncbi:MAG TPA: ABC transporter ATP-binding protein [Ktedonobacteraceae bacterium]|nr:ABC transporter ATP-binding protein [Ktedonobacteraceae bacterium]